MEETENAEDPVARELERRGMPRCTVNEEATLLLLTTGSLIPCQLVELSLGGCRMEMARRIPVSQHTPVEASFKINGIAFRLGGSTGWIAGKTAGVSFGPMSSRRRDDLVEVLCEVESAHAAKAEKETLSAGAPAQDGQSQRPGTVSAEDHKLTLLESAPKNPSSSERGKAQKNGALSAASPMAGSTAGSLIGPVAGPVAGSSGGPVLVREPQSGPTSPGQPGNVASAPAKSDRRTAPRCDLDTSAVIYLVKVGSKLSGQVLDLSLGGCRIRTAARFPAGIYTRVETEFRLQGVPLRLAGVVQAIHDRDLVGVRFLDVSQRKREQVTELIEEIMKAREAADADEESGAAH
ncbi:MAG TPA: PilZ domain-containing protein [Terracidiphilus sp.]|jgi:c-di-GMP-binding flagellar brake protein YcgR